MIKQSKEFKDFIIESYNKIKKAKKSPRNFNVFLEGKSFCIEKVELGPEYKSVLMGNLYQLFTNCQEWKVVDSVEKIIAKTPIFTTPIVTMKGTKIDAYTGFDIHWIPILKTLMKFDLMEQVQWNNLDDLEQKEFQTKENFNNFINWIKL